MRVPCDGFLRDVSGRLDSTPVTSSTHSPNRIICCKLTPVGGKDAKWLIFFHSCGVMLNFDMVERVAG